MQKIETSDLVKDEYGNHYLVVGATADKGTLKNIQVSHLWYEQAFRGKFEDVGRKPVGMQLQEQVNGYIEEMHSNNRPIYGIRDLIANQIDVYAVDISKPHPNSVL